MKCKGAEHLIRLLACAVHLGRSKSCHPSTQFRVGASTQPPTNIHCIYRRQRRRASQALVTKIGKSHVPRNQIPQHLAEEITLVETASLRRYNACTVCNGSDIPDQPLTCPFESADALVRKRGRIYTAVLKPRLHHRERLARWRRGMLSPHNTEPCGTYPHRLSSDK
ncbi:hypothetical protein K456DRAFT_1039791 [Colletotrichum gloeosporioides 23]|nr:hypothetical protein K456DRAFT_1039791 [Colletotrichum gloeosporioides 23]